eukprot:scaffold217980_cov30-Tisochrysis_lutea.AAC.2
MTVITSTHVYERIDSVARVKSCRVKVRLLRPGTTLSRAHTHRPEAGNESTPLQNPLECRRCHFLMCRITQVEGVCDVCVWRQGAVCGIKF